LAWFPIKRRQSAPAVAQADGPPPLAGRYRLGRVIGRGAGAEVREAIDLVTGAAVAVKLIFLPPDLAAPLRQEWSNRLEQEAALALRLLHPDIIAVLATGLANGQAWMAMERVRGVDLGRYLEPSRLLPETLVLRIGARLGAALAHAHAQGIVHRDLKPANVLVNLGAGQVKLADFGVARHDDHQHTRTGMTLGTPAYMSPELLAGAPASPASDTYALGVMLFELLSGRRPHRAATLGELLYATAHEAPAALGQLRPDLPAPAVAAIEQLLANDPAARPADLAHWSAQLAALAALMTRVQAPLADPPL
jgi:serine/threonine-protein kinase